MTPKPKMTTEIVTLSVKVKIEYDTAAARQYITRAIARDLRVGYSSNGDEGKSSAESIPGTARVEL